MNKQKVKIVVSSTLAKEMAKVRNSGLMNMYNKSGVSKVLHSLGYNESSDKVCSMERDEYIALLNVSAQYGR